MNKASNSAKDVGVLDHGTIESEGAIETTGLGPCIGIAVYDSSQSKAAILHIPGASEMPEVLSEFLDGLLLHSSTDTLRVWISGGLAESESVIEDRKCVLSEMRKRGFLEDKIEVCWNTNSDTVVSMHIDLDRRIYRHVITDILENPDDEIAEEVDI